MEFIYRSCTRGPCPCSYTLGTGWHSPPVGTALGSAPPRWGRMRCLATNLSWQLQRLPEALGETLSAQACCLSCLWLPTMNGLMLLCRSVHQGVLALSGGASLPSSVSLGTTPGSFQLGLHSALLKRPRLRSLCLWLEGRNDGERTVPTSLSIPRGGGRDGTARLADLLWVETLNTGPF